MSDIKLGDRVRVERVRVVEGVVEYVTSDGRNFDLCLDDHKGFSTNSSDVVTKLASPLKVGDVVQPHDYGSLPTGTVLASYGSGKRPAVIREPGGDWYFIDQGRAFPPNQLSSERKILFLPES